MPSQEINRPDLTIQEFCDLKNLSRSSYFKIRRAGNGPAEIRPPGTDIIRITPAAVRDWDIRMVELGKSKQAQLERQRRSALRRAAGKASSRKRRHRDNPNGGTTK
jgi:hypothetical protein